MKAYAQKQNQPQQQVTPNIPRSSAKSLAATPLVDSIMHLHRAIGNQAVQRLLHANAEGLDAGSDTAATTRFAHDFSRIPVHSKAPVKLQAKLKVNIPGDIYEQEADRVAEQVTSMPEPELQRTCACGGGCPSCKNEQADHQHLQTKPIQSNHSGAVSAPPIVNEVLHSSGQPLDTSTRESMESRFGHDFSRVRVHTGARAAESARAVNALAYTTGHDVVFGKEQYDPGTSGGRRLLAHELTHVMQQSPVHTTPQHGISAPPRAIFRQVDLGSLFKRVFVPGRVINKSKKAVAVWSSDVGFYTIAAGSESQIFEDVDHIKDEQGQWYKIGPGNLVVIDAGGKISGYKCKVKGPHEECPKQPGLEKPERSLTPAVSTGVNPHVNPER